MTKQVIYRVDLDRIYHQHKRSLTRDTILGLSIDLCKVMDWSFTIMPFRYEKT